MTELTSVKGIGPKTAEALLRLGISDLESLLAYWPRDYEIFSEPKPCYALTPGMTETVEGVLTRDATLNFHNGMRIVNAYLSDPGGRLQLSWYNLPYIRGSLKTGVRYVFRGRVYEKNGRKLMYQPQVYSAEAFYAEYAGKLLPVYALTKGVSNALLRKTAAEALRQRTLCRDWLSPECRRKAALCDINYAVSQLHFPDNREALVHARRRMCFDEFLFFLLGIGQLKRRNGQAQSAYRMKPDFRLLKFIADLPFSLTDAQQKAWREISADLCSGRVMNRMLEGDVGSGKTIVALLGMLLSALNGNQAVLMAPTEVLAAQHYETVRRFLNGSDLPLSAVLLTGSMSAAEKRAAYARIAAHEADLIIGTHALFQEGLQYDRLGLVVTDEQHRFGVGQRARLAEKGGQPHILVMSATPIPRSLAIVLYGDLDLSVLDARPEGRKPIKNCVVGPDYRRTAYKFILDEVKKGRQAYVICPAIEKEEDAERQGEGMQTLSGSAMLENVTDYAKRLSALYPPEITVGVLHGRMNAQKKEEVMRAFQSGALRVLVSTTVVEVGVDVPNATVMMIENADRFGLAQLHQLRGRVGRGREQSYCIMINSSESDTAAKRLDIMNRSNDGFYIAGEDLRLRGPGDLFGIRQSGEMNFRFADIYQDAEILALAKEESGRILAEDPELAGPEHALLKERLRAYEAVCM